MVRMCFEIPRTVLLTYTNLEVRWRTSESWEVSGWRGIGRRPCCLATSRSVTSRPPRPILCSVDQQEQGPQRDGHSAAWGVPAKHVRRLYLCTEWLTSHPKWFYFPEYCDRYPLERLEIPGAGLDIVVMRNVSYTARNRIPVVSY